MRTPMIPLSIMQNSMCRHRLTAHPSPSLISLYQLRIGPYHVFLPRMLQATRRWCMACPSEPPPTSLHTIPSMTMVKTFLPPVPRVPNIFATSILTILTEHRVPLRASLKLSRASAGHVKACGSVRKKRAIHECSVCHKRFTGSAAFFKHRAVTQPNSAQSQQSQDAQQHAHWRAAYVTCIYDSFWHSKNAHTSAFRCAMPGCSKKFGLHSLSGIT
jgi:hypothetical protein